METKKSYSCRYKDDRKKIEEQKYSGLAINAANDNKVNKDLIRERTATLNNNPRNEK